MCLNLFEHVDLAGKMGLTGTAVVIDDRVSEKLRGRCGNNSRFRH